MFTQSRPWGALLGVASITFIAGSASATHNIPLKTAKLVVPLVRAYTTCTSPTSTAPPELLGLPACPATTLSTNATHTFTLGPKGKGTITAKVVKGPDIKITVVINDVLQDGVPYDLASLSVSTTVHYTVDGCSPPGSCTSIEFASIPYYIFCRNGTCRATFKVGEDTGGFNPVVAGFRDNIEIDDIVVGAPSGPGGDTETFLRPGLVVP